MGLEHPDITHIRKTGYPRPIGKPNKEKYTCLDYIKEKEREQMDLERINNVIERIKSIEKEADEKIFELESSIDDRIIGIGTDNKIQFFSIEDIKSYTGKEPKVVTRDDDYYAHEAVVVIDDYKFFALLDDEEVKEYEQATTKS